MKIRCAAGLCRPGLQGEAWALARGMKASGYGRFGGKAVIDEFTNLGGLRSRALSTIRSDRGLAGRRDRYGDIILREMSFATV